MKIIQCLMILASFALVMTSVSAKGGKKSVIFIHSYDHHERLTTDILIDSSTALKKEMKARDKEKALEYKEALKEYTRLKKAGIKDATPKQRAKALGKDDGDQDAAQNGQPVVRSITTRFGGSRGNLSEDDFGKGEKEFAIKPVKPKTIKSKTFSIKASEEDALMEALDEVYVDEEIKVDAKFKKIAVEYQKFLAKAKK